MSTDDLVATNELLMAELPDVRYSDADARYLRWLYEENPYGPAYQESVDEDGVRIAHYALIPQDYRGPDGPVPGAFSLHAVTRSGTQRKGYFVSLGLELYARAGADGRDIAIGIPNEKSVNAGPKYLGWRLEGQIPVKICIPTTVRTGTTQTFRATPEFLASDRFAGIAADLDAFPTTSITNSWTTAGLRWRLARPHAEHAVHVTPDLVAVSLRTVQRGVPAAVIMKVLPRGGRRGPLSGRAIVTAACRHHRAPLAIHAGWNEHVNIAGIEPPRWIRPAPLFLLLRSLRDGVDQDAIRLSTYEFLDMDAF